MKIQETVQIALWGNFGLQVFDHSSGTPRRILRVRKKNQITNEGRIALLNLLGAGDQTGWEDTLLENRVWSLGAGTNGTPPTIDDDRDTMSLVWISKFAFNSGECQVVASPPNSYYLSISKILPQGDAIGDVLQEAGVFTRGLNDDPSVVAAQSLYARQQHSPVTKTGNMTIQYDWQLGITIQS
jgi:hypothetical protein